MVQINYLQGIAHMSNLTATMSTKMYSNTYIPLPTYPQFVLLYPGKLGIKDYLAVHNGTSTFHKDNVTYLHDLALQNNSVDLTNYLMDIFNNGLYANHNVPLNLNNVFLNNFALTTEQLKYIIFWITLQEDINYPRPRYKGVKLPFMRYVEALIAAYDPNIITLNHVILRTNNRNNGLPITLTHQGLPNHFVNAINILK